MAEVKWIKLCTDIFSNRKIRQIESMPEGDAIIVIWLKLLTLAGETNAGGMVYFSKSIPYTEQMLATAFNRPLATVQLALRTFEAFGMIEIVDNFINIPNWEKYQSIDRLAEIREYNRLAQQKRRERLRAENEAETKSSHVNDKSMTSQRCHETDIDIDKELEPDKEKEKLINNRGLSSCNNAVADAYTVDGSYNDTAKPQNSGLKAATEAVGKAWNKSGFSLARSFSLKSERAKMISERVQHYGLETVLSVIEQAARSEYLTALNERKPGIVTLDWFLNADHFQKIYEGVYDRTWKNAEKPTSGADRLLEKIARGDYDE